MRNIERSRLVLGAFLVLTLFVAACTQVGEPAPTPTPTESVQETLSQDGEQVEIQRDPEVPELPFPDNPDPDQCGIPQQWGKDAPAWLSGHYQGELVQPTVFLYDSHLRKQVKGSAPTGAKVKIILYQSNPVLDYYMVRTIDTEHPQEGWVPAPFLSFEPVENTG